ncbi:MAG: hypothetical protein A3I63_07425 [Betaproteobacteria bacterium RIFCSPLOWO2_02_FULL_66_14]|nr:MAG: hypothetical protein A3I63_07425 [Betaproteobacteria bacterium RIFCSPLOWO2_02_FULL_66_14]
MGRFVLLIVALFVLIWLVRSAFSARRRPRDVATDADSAELVRCAHCGTHLPRNEARESEGLNYCSDDHRRLGPRIS